MTLERMKEFLIELKEEEHELQERLYYCQGNIREIEYAIKKEEYMYRVCPIIREQLNDRKMYDISASEVDDIARDLLLEIDLDKTDLTEEVVCSLLDKYLETY